MTAGIGSLGFEILDRLIQSLFQSRPAHASLNGDGLIGLVETDYLIEAKSHIQRDSAFHAFDTAGDRASAAIDIDRDLMGNTVIDDLLDLILVIRIDDTVRYVLDLLLSQTEKIVHRLSVGD